MELAKDIYVNTDKIILDREYSLVYTGEVRTCDKVYLRYAGKENLMEKKDYGYVSKITIYNKEESFDIVQGSKLETFKLYAYEVPEKLLEYNKELEIKLLPVKDLMYVKITKVLKNTIKKIPTLFEKRLGFNYTND